MSVISIEPYIGTYDPHYMGYESNFIRFNISIDGKSIDSQSLIVAIKALMDSVKEGGKHYFFTCICGEYGCAGFSEPVRVKHHVCQNGKVYVVWSYGFDETKYARFELGQYKNEIYKALLKAEGFICQFPEYRIYVYLGAVYAKDFSKYVKKNML